VAELGVAGKACVIRCPHEAFDESIPQVVVRTLFGMDVEHRGMAAT